VLDYHCVMGQTATERSESEVSAQDRVLSVIAVMLCQYGGPERLVPEGAATQGPVGGTRQRLRSNELQD
jgi:hypothetical protein